MNRQQSKPQNQSNGHLSMPLSIAIGAGTGLVAFLVSRKVMRQSFVPALMQAGALAVSAVKLAHNAPAKLSEVMELQGKKGIELQPKLNPEGVN